MTYYLQHSDWMSSLSVPEGMNLDMLNDLPNRLESLLKPALAKHSRDSIVIDLGAGTGVLGMFALSQGAKFVYFVERDPQMFHILSNVLPNKLDSSSFKLINKDIEDLTIDDFDCGTPDVVVSEFYGPRLFDEGYVNYTKHLRSFIPECYFIPESFQVDFYLAEVDYTQPIWPAATELIEHFKFMYKEKGFAKHIEFTGNQPVGTIKFDANRQTFDNGFVFKYELTDDRLLIGKASIFHDNLTQYYTTLGWLMTAADENNYYKILYDELNYFNPVKQEVNNAQ
jgi:predicted RNA methylase